MKKLMLLAAMLAMVVMMVVAAPVMAQQDKGKGKGKQKQEMPKTGGVPIDASLLGLGAGAALVGGGLLVRRVSR